MLALKGEQELIWRATELDMVNMYYRRGLLKAEQYSGEFPSLTLTLMAGGANRSAGPSEFRRPMMAQKEKDTIEEYAGGSTEYLQWTSLFFR